MKTKLFDYKEKIVFRTACIIINSNNSLGHRILKQKRLIVQKFYLI